MSDNDIILYTTDDGQAQFVLRQLGGQLWLSQAELADLYQVSPQAITQHIRAVYEEGELTPEATCKEYLQVQKEGNREVERSIKHYSLPVILAVGYRVRSKRGTQFRQWATRTLDEYMTKGFVLDDERLKEPKWDYFDELLERIRDIRSSEKRFYQKVRDLFTLAEDYRANEKETRLLFAETQNKLFYAVTGHTAAELIVARADSSKPNMNLLSFKGERVRKADVIIAKNYLNAEELDHLNRLVSIFFEFAELRTKQKQHITLGDWRKYVDNFMAFNEQPLLSHTGKISRDEMKDIAHQRYETFDNNRTYAEAVEADKIEVDALDKLEKELQQKKKDRE